MYLIKKLPVLLAVWTALFIFSCSPALDLPGESGQIESSENTGTIAAQDEANFAAATGWKLVWSDEFDYSGQPDPSKWSYDVGGHGWGNDELQYYTDNRRENARVENGNLIITLRKESWGGREYTSARMVSKNKGDWLYGKVEARAKLPWGKGTWPAIWMLPTDNVYGGWPFSGELDIMEHVGYDQDIVHQTIHTGSYYHKIGTQKAGQKHVLGASESFHIYSMEWFEDKVDFFIDGDLVFTFNNEYNTSNEWPFDQRFHLILNIAFGGSWGGLKGVDDWYLPVSMEVDYVRVYEQGAAEPHTVPGKIEAEAYTSQNGVQIENCDEGGQNVGYIDAGDSMTYTVNVTRGGTYRAEYRVAGWENGALQLKSGSTVLDSVAIPNTGAYQNWDNASSGNTFTLTEGVQDLVIASTGSGWNINHFTLTKVGIDDYSLTLLPANQTTGSGTYEPDSSVTISYTGSDKFLYWSGDADCISSPASATATVVMSKDNLVYTAVTEPGEGETIVVQAEDYTRKSGGNVESCDEGGSNMGWLDAGVWLEYEVDAQGGSYEVKYRASAWENGAALQIDVNGMNNGTTVLPLTSAYQSWQTVKKSGKVTLNPGINTIRITSSGGGWNFNWFSLSSEITVPKYTLSLSPAGETSGAGLYEENDVVTISYTGQDEFEKWTGDTAAVANVYSQTTTVVMTGNINLTAQVDSGIEEITLEAEHYTAQSGTQTEDCSEGGQNVGWIDTNDWMDYSITVKGGTYKTEYRVAGWDNSASLKMLVDGQQADSTTITNTGAYQNWTSETGSVTLSAGTHTIRILASGPGWNINWFKLTKGTDPNKYTLTLGPSGLTSGAGSYDPNSVVNIGYNGPYQFIRWSGDTGAVANVYSASTTVVMTGDTSLTAEYTINDDVFENMGLIWNLGNSLDSLGGETGWGNPVTTGAMIAKVSEKFNTMRLPVTWFENTGPAPDYRINESYLARVKEVIDYAYDNDMYVILNMMHENSWLKPQTAGLDAVDVKFAAMWRQIAEYFKDYDEHLLFEAMNEPRIEGGENEFNGGTADGWTAINRLNATFVRTVRQTGGNNTGRWILVTPFGANAILGAQNLVIPPGDNIMVSVHFYAPWDFCAEWGEDLKVWDGSRNYIIDDNINNVKRLFVDKGYHVIWTEFGAANKAYNGGTNENEVANWASYFISSATNNGMKCAWWDNNKTGVGDDQLGIFDRYTLQWTRPVLLDRMVEAAR